LPSMASLQEWTTTMHVTAAATRDVCKATICHGNPKLPTLPRGWRSPRARSERGGMFKDLGEGLGTLD
jgi:hypothetical protein